MYSIHNFINCIHKFTLNYNIFVVQLDYPFKIKNEHLYVDMYVQSRTKFELHLLRLN